MIYSNHVCPPVPESPPELSCSKSSVSSSFYSSYQSDNNTLLSTCLGNFEEIILDDEAPITTEIRDYSVKKPLTIYPDQSYINNNNNPRKLNTKRSSVNKIISGNRELVVENRKSCPTSRNPLGGIIRDSLSLEVLPKNGKRFVSSPLSSPAQYIRRNRSLSPMVSNCHKPNTASLRHPNRSIWQANRQRKTTEELEKEFEDDDGDDVPDDCFLENIPISPRPLSQQSQRYSKSTSTSPERPTKGKTKPLGNGTSAQPAEQGELRSPRLGVSRVLNGGRDHFKTRAVSWSAAMSDLSQEAKELTAALEELQNMNSKTNGTVSTHNEKIRAKSAFAELPPLRRTEIMIDPLPISREKEAVLSRTRPSWLPPKNPAEEKRHLKEYQKMMALSLEADRKKETARRKKAQSHDETAKNLLKIWEERVLPNWDTAIGQKKTKDLWWKGIAPRSRGCVWKKAIGNELGLSNTSYAAALGRAQDLEVMAKNGSQLGPDEQIKNNWFKKIRDDVRRVYPELKIFQSNGPLHSSLIDVLKAYVMYRSDVGYIFGTSTCAALLLLNLPTPSDAFIALANLLNRPLPQAFHTSENGAIEQICSLLLSTLKQKSFRLYSHLTSPSIDLIKGGMSDFFTSMGTTHLSLDNATRLWDIMVFEKDNLLIRAAVTYLINVECKLFGAVNTQEVFDVVQGDILNIEETEWVDSLREVYKL